METNNVDVIGVMSAVSNLSREELLSKCRRDDIVKCRFMMFHVLRKAGMTLCDLEKEFGLTHATIMHGIRRVDDMLKYPCYKEEKGLYYEFINMLAEDGCKAGDESEDVSE